MKEEMKKINYGADPEPTMPNWYNDNEEGDILDLLITILEEMH